MIMRRPRWVVVELSTVIGYISCRRMCPTNLRNDLFLISLFVNSLITSKSIPLIGVVIGSLKF